MKHSLMIALQKRVMPGYEDCGDQLMYWQDEKLLMFCVVDGLGHGTKAMDAALQILDYVEAHRDLQPEALFRACDTFMCGKRGGVMAIGWICDDQLRYVSVGNIKGVLCTSKQEHGGNVVWKLNHLHMNRGMIGGGFRKISISTKTLDRGDLLILHSDGIPSFFSLKPSWENLLQDPEALAKLILKDAAKDNDDACVLLYRHEKHEKP